LVASNEDFVAPVITQNDPRWAAIVARDAQADGCFYYSVRTTGVYCRPSCAARLPRPENVLFFQTREDAEHAGFRPCKRCKPDQPTLAQQYVGKVTEACRIIEESTNVPKLKILAESVCMSSYHFHRIFKQVTGLTPKEYASAHREKRLRDELGSSGTITAAIYEAGYGSSGRFYQNSSEVLGMTPTNYRGGGANTEIRFAVGECSLGSVLVAQSDRGVCAILLGDDPAVLVRDLQDRFSRAHLIGGDNMFEFLVAQVVGFVDAPGIGLNLPLDIRGTAFQRRVWEALRQIPPGETATYSEIARRIGAPSSARAVAGACAANALAVAIPCHRIVRNDGALSGYRWSVERKRALLKKEAGKEI
jgi:AraC family transcriptional regulator of adaptative response/methylated-DNA-[protein]-cysteine methyltransferase